VNKLDEPVEFLGAVFKPSDLALIRVIEVWTTADCKKKSRIVRTQHLTVEDLASPETWQRFLQIAERSKANLFFGVCPRTRPNADKARDIRLVRVLWADLDHCTPEEALRRCADAALPPPSVVVNSGHGVHLYWLLLEPYQIDDHEPNATSDALSLKAERIQAILKGISGAIAGDHCQDLARILRLPSTMNRKNQRNGEAPVPCELTQCEPARRYPLSVFEAFAAPTAAPAPTSAPEPRGPHLSPRHKQRLDELVRECATAADRSKADFALCAWAIENSIDQEVVWQQVQDVGKPEERGRGYFDLTWAAAEAKVKPNDAARNGTPPQGNAGTANARPTGYDIILAHFKDTYRPSFHRGTAIFSEALGRDVTMAEGCAGAPIALIGQLAGAVDAPRNDGGVARSRLPYFFGTWSRSAWVDLLGGLPNEEEAANPSLAGQDLHDKLAEVLHTIVALGTHYQRAGMETRVERRSLIEFCRIWAKPRWQSIRSYTLWCRFVVAPTAKGEEGKGEEGKDQRAKTYLQVALRRELFRQVNRQDLAQLSQAKLSGLCERYKIGRAGRIGGGTRVVILSRRFAAELLPRLPSAQGILNP
jgi:hypothetical protein